LKISTIKRIQRIPASREKVWDFFSKPDNLHLITPKDMRFETISVHDGKKIFSGQLIEYKLAPLFGIPMYWMTEILQVCEPEFFIDIQRKGPYSLWKHQHFFKEIEGGTEMMDLVQYKAPYWIIGGIANQLYLKRKLNAVFNFRFQMVEEIFGKWRR
jgi:ligand-binding SRPBCC domain-containing protein